MASQSGVVLRRPMATHLCSVVSITSYDGYFCRLCVSEDGYGSYSPHPSAHMSAHICVHRLNEDDPGYHGPSDPAIWDTPPARSMYGMPTGMTLDC